MILINDLHCGAERKAGVTHSSAKALKEFITNSLEGLLSKGDDVVVLGDVLDQFLISTKDLIDAYLVFVRFLERPNSKLTLVAGNHDISMRGDQVSSFALLTTVLKHRFTNVVIVGIDETLTVDGYIHIVAHHRNQELFDLTLAKVLSACQRGDYVLLHANYDNKFAEQADHSLNVSAEQALEFTKKGVDLLFAHEHHHRREIPHGTPADGGSVVCLGNQIPTSVSDVLGRADKFYWELWEEGLRKHRVWMAEGNYAELDWRSLPQDNPAKFIRVVGDAVNAEAAQVIDAIHRFRQKSNAFVITNAVRIEGIADIESLPATFEAAKKFDVMEFVYKQLDETEAALIRKIVGEME